MSKFQVLVIEAGPTYVLNSKLFLTGHIIDIIHLIRNDGALNTIVPAFEFKLQKTIYDWNYTTSPGTGMSNRSIPMVELTYSEDAAHIVR